MGKIETMSVEFPEATDEIKAILTNPDIKKMIEAVEQLIVDDRDLSAEQWEYYKQRVNGKIEKLTDEIKSTAKKLTDIDPTDTMEEKRQKLRLHKHLISFLENAFESLKKAFRYIFQQIKKGIKWCRDRLKETYASFKRLFY